MTGQSLITDINGIIPINCEEHHPVLSAKIVISKGGFCAENK